MGRSERLHSNNKMIRTNFRWLGLMLIFVTMGMGAASAQTNELFMKAHEAQSQGNYPLAISYWTAILRENPKSAAAYSNRAMAYFSVRNYDQAISDCTDAIRMNPKHSIYYVNRSAAYSAKRQFDQALSDCNSALQIDTTNSWVYDARGRVYLETGDLGKALSDFDSALKLDAKPGAATAGIFNARGVVYRKQGQFDKAISDFNRAIELDPRYAAPLANRASAFSNKGEFDRALADFKASIRLAPEAAEGYNNLAWLLATCPIDAVRNGEEAVEAATTACRLTHWNSRGTIDTLAAAYAEAGNFGQAVKYQRQTLENIPNDERAQAEARLKLYEDRKPYRDRSSL